jgi:hypothetical protein
MLQYIAPILQFIVAVVIPGGAEDQRIAADQQPHDDRGRDQQDERLDRQGHQGGPCWASWCCVSGCGPSSGAP